MGVVPYHFSMLLPLPFRSGIPGRSGQPSVFGGLPVCPDIEHQACLVPLVPPWTVFWLEHYPGSTTASLPVWVVAVCLHAAGAGVVHSVMALWTEMAFVPPGSQAPGTCLPLVLPVVLVLGY